MFRGALLRGSPFSHTDFRPTCGLRLCHHGHSVHRLRIAGLQRLKAGGQVAESFCRLGGSVPLPWWALSCDEKSWRVVPFPTCFNNTPQSQTSLSGPVYSLTLNHFSFHTKWKDEGHSFIFPLCHLSGSYLDPFGFDGGTNFHHPPSPNKTLLLIYFLGHGLGSSFQSLHWAFPVLIFTP